ncbi:MAG: ComEA family DNA-binding protein [Planctomycetota bacterium]
MTQPSPRVLAYVGLWALLFGVVAWRHVPPGDVTVQHDLAPPAAFRLDLNQAPWERLMLIEGIGETLAKRIVAAREERGGFTSVEQVMALPGVPDRPLREASDWVVVGPRPAGPTD